MNEILRVNIIFTIELMKDKSNKANGGGGGVALKKSW